MIRTVVVAVLASAALLAGCSSSNKSSNSPVPGTATPGGAPASASVHGVLGTLRTPFGTVLTDSAGRTIYRFAPDRPGVSTCSGSCLQYWPAVLAPAVPTTSAPGISAPIGNLKRSDGTRQLTVAGYPVYTYVGDSHPGMTAGQGVNTSGGLWWVISVNGTAVTARPSSSGGSSSAGMSGPSSSSAGGRGGYGGR
jgi:predicted lipoprotein with Yx(FWY)xxD motif